MLFGLGVPGGTRLALHVLAGTAAAVGLPSYAILCLPVLFAAGMSVERVNVAVVRQTWLSAG